MSTDVPELLERAGFTLGVAESLTGGVLSDTFARMPDAAEWFKGGLVAYSAAVKRRILGIGSSAVVSEDAALAMADHVAELLDCDVAVSATGVGGPEPEGGLAPGTVWMALHLPTETTAKLHTFDGEPDDVIKQTCGAAVEWVRDALRD